MSTLEALKKLSDSEFHRLGDDLIRRLEPRYRRLRSHGINDRGESIKGQPDSYVGESANTCKIGFCYTTQRAGWWAKIVDDVKEAVKISPTIEEIVAAIPHNSDRDALRNSNWLSDAQSAAAGATFRIYDGRQLTHLLDSEHQDLRYQHLGIPYSRLTPLSILASGQSTTAATIDAIRASGRFDPNRYVSRSADGELFRLWQNSFSREEDSSRRVAPIRMIALVNDSGLGKTSLACHFAASLSAVAPVVLIQARNLTFNSEDALVAFVIQSLQGVLAPSIRIGEEAAIVKHLVSAIPLTVIVDGLDETHAPNSVRKAISFWLDSRIGSRSVLIVTSRQEFWRMCSDEHWRRWLPASWVDNRPLSSIKPRSETGIERTEPNAGTRLPEKFTPRELEHAWTKSGNSTKSLDALSDHARNELLHPFSLRVYLDLVEAGWSRPEAFNQTDLMEAWLNRRLDAEADNEGRLSRPLFERALRIAAAQIASANGTAVPVDALGDVPRFDSAHPPGPVVERLIGAGILETVPQRPDLIRFSVEGVQDFYRAEADAESIETNPIDQANTFVKGLFTDVYVRLLRLGRRLQLSEASSVFINKLLNHDARKAAVVLSGADPARYEKNVRLDICEKLGTEINARHRVVAACAISLLGQLDCSESSDVLMERLSKSESADQSLKSLAATALIRQNCVKAVEFIYRWKRSGVSQGNETYYFRDELALLRNTEPEFRKTLISHAELHLDNPSGSKIHARAVYFLASLGAAPLSAHLSSRLSQNGMLRNYENHALFALGTDAAGRIFAASARAVVERLAKLPNNAENNTARFNLMWPLYSSGADLRYLLTPEFEPYLKELFTSDNSDLSAVGRDIVRKGRVTSLYFDVAVSVSKITGWLGSIDHRGERDAVTEELWMDWWHRTSDTSVRLRLLEITPRYPTILVERVLLDCLDDPNLRGDAAVLLGDYGSVRSTSILRTLFADKDGLSKIEIAQLAHALGSLRDQSSIPLLAEAATSHPGSHIAMSAIESLGIIGTPEAEAALIPLVQEKNSEYFASAALLKCGRSPAVKLVIKMAQLQDNGLKWLCSRISRISMTRGWSRGKYLTHLDTRSIVDYLKSKFEPTIGDNGWDLIHALERIDSPEVRQFLRELVRERGPNDAVVRKDDLLRLSFLSADELKDRGDPFVIPQMLDERTDKDEDEIYVWRVADRLRYFDSEPVAAEIRSRLLVASNDSQNVRLLALLGKFGKAVDAEIILPFIGHSNTLIANVAYEAVWRLTDPLLVPDGWSEI